VRRRTLTLLVLVSLLTGSLLWAVTLGSVSIPLPTLLRAFLDRLPWVTADAGSPVLATILFQLRLPRILLAMLVGGGLALCGAVLQGLFRNPMADPGIIGVSSGGALGAVVAITSGLAILHPWTLPLLAFFGAVAATFLIYRLATRHGRTPMATLLLAGLAVGAFLTAMTSFVLSLAQNIFILREMLFWLMGGLDGRGWSHLGLVSGPVLLGSALLLAFSRDLNALALAGEEGALSLGVELARLKRRLLTLTALVTGVVVSVSGIIGFVGLIVPHVIRLLLGPDHRLLLPASFLGGATFLIWADLLTRTLFPTEELRLGVVTAAVGAPFFLFLLHRQRWRTESIT
jgi:iron complex transport system permease protein